MNVLLITPIFNNYYMDIINVLKKNNIDGKWYCDTPKLSLAEKIFCKINKKFFQKKIKKYINKIIKENDNIEYEKILLINGGNFSSNEIKELKQFIKGEYIFYAWDSVNNYPNFLDFLDLFDKKYSFDEKDCKEYNFEFLPLFYSYKYNNEKLYDVCSIMTYNSNKCNNYNRVKYLLPKEIKRNEYLYLPNKLNFLKNLIFKKDEYKYISIKDIHFKKISRSDAYDLMSKSTSILDCPRENQNGLTIRVFEALALNTKIITTNKLIKNYDFYCENNIFIVDSNCKEIPTCFFKKPFDKSHSISEDYFIENFVKKLFNI